MHFVGRNNGYCGTHHTLVTLWSMSKVVTNALACVLVTWGGAYSAQEVTHTS